MRESASLSQGIDFESFLCGEEGLTLLRTLKAVA